MISGWNVLGGAAELRSAGHGAVGGAHERLEVAGDQVIKGQPGGDERQLYDIVYFASAKP